MDRHQGTARNDVPLGMVALEKSPPRVPVAWIYTEVADNRTRADDRGDNMRLFLMCVMVIASVIMANSLAQADPKLTPTNNRAWERTYDLDGDGKKDWIRYKFSGGAHCCYEIGATLSSTHKTVWLPFWMDGGYALGLMTPLDRPDHFTIRTAEGTLPEILMEISTYNGRPEPLPRAWTTCYGIKTHRIGISFPKGRVRVRDARDWRKSDN